MAFVRQASHYCLALVLIVIGCSPVGATPQQGQKKKSPRKTPGRPAAVAPVPQETIPSGVDIFNGDYVGAALSVDLDGAPLFQFLEFFSEQFGFSFVLDKSVKEVEPISVRARRLPWNLLVKSVLQSRGLAIQQQGGLYRILSQEALSAEQEEQRKIERGRVADVPPETRIYRLRYRSVRTGGYLRTGTALGTGGGVMGGGAGGGGLTPVPVGLPDQAGTPGGSPPPGLISGFRAILVNQLTKDGTIEEDPMANLLIVRDVPPVHERIARLLAELDRPEPQIEIEARILVARRDYGRQLGALLNAAVNGQGASGQGGTAINPIAGQRGAPTLPGAQPSEVLGLGTATAGVIGGAIQRGTYALSAALSALETRGVAQTILAPRLIVVNNTPANIGNGVDIPYVQAGPVPGGPGGPGGGIGFGVVPTTQLVNASLGFSVTPQILGEGEEILLSIEIRNDSPSGATPLGQPIIQRQNVTTSIRCPNGGALLLSGLLSDREDQTVNAIPGLRSLPILGKLFQRQERNRTQFELIFFVTARVVNEQVSPVMIERPEGIVIPNVPEYAAPRMPALDMPQRLRERSNPPRQVLVEKPVAPNLPAPPAGGGKGGPRHE